MLAPSLSTLNQEYKQTILLKMTNIPTMRTRGHRVQTPFSLLQFLPRIHLLAGESFFLCVCIIYLLLGVNCLFLSHVLPFWLKTSRARPSPSAKRWLAPSAMFHLFFASGLATSHNLSLLAAFGSDRSL